MLKLGVHISWPEPRGGEQLLEKEPRGGLAAGAWGAAHPGAGQGGWSQERQARTHDDLTPLWRRVPRLWLWASPVN